MNRFNGLLFFSTTKGLSTKQLRYHPYRETVETVPSLVTAPVTRLKPGVNENDNGGVLGQSPSIRK